MKKNILLMIAGSVLTVVLNFTTSIIANLVFHDKIDDSKTMLYIMESQHDTTLKYIEFYCGNKK